MTTFVVCDECSFEVELSHTVLEGGDYAEVETWNHGFTHDDETDFDLCRVCSEKGDE